MRIGIIGLNHKLADLNLREKVAKACHKLFETGVSPVNGHNSVLLSTCNRTEIYFCSDNLADTHTFILNRLRTYVDETEESFDQKLYSYFGLDCFSHIARVTSGLDSAIVGETEIQGQVKVAYEKATKSCQLSSEIHYMFQKSLKIGKQVRSELNFGRGILDLEHALLNISHQVFAEKTDPSILFIGASNINRKILNFLKNKNLHNISICNRTLEKTAGFADAYDLRRLHWENLSRWHEFDWIVFGTKCPDYLISQNEIPEGTFSPKLVIDLCVPRNVDPAIEKNAHISLFNIDQINQSLKTRKKQMIHAMTHAESFVSEASKKQVDIFCRKNQKKVWQFVQSA